MFGYSRGAFTGAITNKIGLIEAADKGTLFLDEIGELPRELQVKLLRVLQERQVRPVGNVQCRSVNIRVIAATNRDLDSAVAEGAFRQDLFYRLNVVRLRMPPLRERLDDIPILVAAFVEKYANQWRRISHISEDVWKKLAGWYWPGNVRELQNTIERAVALGEGNELKERDLGLDFSTSVAEVSVTALSGAALDNVEKKAIGDALRNCGGNRTAAAKLLGIGKSTLYRKLRSYQSTSFDTCKRYSRPNLISAINET